VRSLDARHHESEVARPLAGRCRLCRQRPGRPAILVGVWEHRQTSDFLDPGDRSSTTSARTHPA